jgi:geranylgeranyl diphosphate synthase type I
MVASPGWLPVPFTAGVEVRIAELLAGEEGRWSCVDPRMGDPIRALAAFVRVGGKRLRPVVAHWAFVGAGGDPADPRLVDLGAALELLHAFALVHDDVMDHTDSRRGAPTVHAAARARHAAGDRIGDAGDFGDASAILVGDLAHAYADDLLRSADPALMPIWQELRVEVNLGQYLDLEAAAAGDRSPATARAIARYKSGRYTIEHPLRLGAGLAGDPALADALLAYGEPVGRAFQLRDDVLGCFGDPARTGKPVGSDIREGKATLLIAEAHARAGAADAARLDRELRAVEPDTDAVLALIVESGALTSVEAEIDQLVDRAVAALDGLALAHGAEAALGELARFVASRDR